MQPLPAAFFFLKTSMGNTLFIANTEIAALLANGV
ncbi:hypothetical protein NIASO_12410 [Niabella soli DSM 19437]|uniref:Uncharacterized protein n=1 Tax=Niabella soli DSM 19437 TaxID=929713 RepID=W0F7C1_9BACT|nr:hypothetical protein NIASO_12410 [Niabella soli DSM 19437]